MGKKRLGEILCYEQPTKYVVNSTDYDSSYSIPVLTAGKTFILGYTNEIENVFINIPVIIFDDFTTASKFVDFEFKVKSAAIKILSLKSDIQASIRLIYEFMQKIQFPRGEHKRYWISEYQYMTILFPTLPEQQKIASFLYSINTKISLAQKKSSVSKIL